MGLSILEKWIKKAALPPEGKGLKAKKGKTYIWW